MNGRGNELPLSPVSLGSGSVWSGISKYQNLENDNPYSNNRGQLASPPVSSGSTGTMNSDNFPRGGSVTGPNSGPSPPASIARSSQGPSLYNGSQYDGGRRRDEQTEGTLQEHYISLKRFLAASLRDEKGNPRPNKARDKLLRLSFVQFQELSTDVFDELQRRQAAGRRTPNGGSDGPGPAPFLLPKDSFHPKRNQARQKLSTLPPPRFRDLATDVFYELERRFPQFTGGDIPRTDSPASMRGPPSRIGTPVNGGPPFRPGSRAGGMQRPSETSSVSSYVRSESRQGGMMSGPQSPGMPPNGYDRPQAKTFQSNTIVPNKGTMVEDDDDATGGEDDDEDAFGLESAARGDNKPLSSSDEKAAIEKYQTQVAELEEKLSSVEATLHEKDTELNNVLDAERDRASATNVEKQKWTDLRLELEGKLADAQHLNDSLQTELDKLRGAQANTERELRAEIEDLKAENLSGGSNVELERENQELRAELKEQQEVTDDVRREAQAFLREMKMISERSGTSYQREEELINQINRLEEEVKDWRNRYAKTKTQLRSLRASSMGLTIQQDAAQYAKDNEFAQADGLVKDVHVTKFQISIDELLRTARGDDPTKVVEFMKAVIVNVRRITQDIDESSTATPEMAQEQTKLKSRVSATANNLITASKNFAAAKGLSPLSLLDAAASHLTAAVVELIRTVKIRPTPAGELEDDDDGNLPPVDSTGFFPLREERLTNGAQPFLGLRNERTSAVSSMYSPENSPRSSINPRPRSSSGKDGWASRRPVSRGTPLSNLNGDLNGVNGSKGPAPVAFGIRTQDSDVEYLKIFLEDQTALLVQVIQSLVSAIRSETGMTAITTEITAIASVVGKVVTSTETAMSSTGNVELRVQGEPIVKKLAACRQRLVDAVDKGKHIANMGDEDEDIADKEWRAWTQSLPPIAFEIARETKELVQRVDVIDGSNTGRGEDGYRDFA